MKTMKVVKYFKHNARKSALIAAILLTVIGLSALQATKSERSNLAPVEQSAPQAETITENLQKEETQQPEQQQSPTPPDINNLSPNQELLPNPDDPNGPPTVVTYPKFTVNTIRVNTGSIYRNCQDPYYSSNVLTVHEVNAVSNGGAGSITWYLEMAGDSYESAAPHYQTANIAQGSFSTKLDYSPAMDGPSASFSAVNLPANFKVRWRITSPVNLTSQWVSVC